LNAKTVAYSPNGMDDLDVKEIKSNDKDQNLTLEDSIPLFDPMDNMFSPGQDMDWVRINSST
jgi:hypothetical protein